MLLARLLFCLFGLASAAAAASVIFSNVRIQYSAFFVSDSANAGRFSMIIFPTKVLEEQKYFAQTR